jgi:hypothetical protein
MTKMTISDADWNAAIADLTTRIETAEANGDNDPQNRLADMRQALKWHTDQLAIALGQAELAS